MAEDEKKDKGRLAGKALSPGEKFRKMSEMDLVRAMVEAEHFLTNDEFAKIRGYKYYLVDRKFGHAAAVRRVAKEFKEDTDRIEKTIWNILSKILKRFVEEREEKEAFERLRRRAHPHWPVITG